MTEAIKHVDLNKNDMVMILGALITIKSCLPNDLENQPEVIQVKAAQLLHLIQRMKEALDVPDDVMTMMTSFFDDMGEDPSKH